MLEKQIYPELGDMRLADITADDIDDWYATLLPAAPTRRSHTYALLSTVMRSASTGRRALISESPCKVERPTVVHRKFEPRPATSQQIATIVDNMPDKYRALILLAAWCGLRWGEVSELRRHLAEYAMPGPDGLLFPNAARTGHLHVNTLSKTYHRPVGSPVVPTYGCTTSGTARRRWAAQAGATLAELMARMGHSTTKAALVYQHVAEGRDRIIAERMALLAEPLLAQPTFPDSDGGRWRP